jgi:hypothetical protein
MAIPMMEIKGTRYYSNKDVIWVRNDNSIVVIQKQWNLSYELIELEASCWEWLHQSYNYDDITVLTSNVYSLPIDEAELLIIGILQKWVDNQLLEVSHG